MEYIFTIIIAWPITVGAFFRVHWIALHCIHHPTPSFLFSVFFFFFLFSRSFESSYVSLSLGVYKKLLLDVQSFRRRCFAVLLSTFIRSLYSSRVDRTRVYVISIHVLWKYKWELLNVHKTANEEWNGAGIGIVATAEKRESERECVVQQRGI